MMGLCRVEGCGKPLENRDNGLCASHNKALRQVVKVPLKKVSDKLQKKLTSYKEASRQFLMGKRCAVFPTLAAQEVHHMAGRSNEMLMDKKYWLAVSRKGHIEIEMNPKLAKEKGWTVSRLTDEPHKI